MIEYLMGTFWSICYLFIVIGGYKYRTERLFFMPLISGALNIAWELQALETSGGYWAHVIWFVLDCIILFQNLCCLSFIKRRIFYSIYVIVSAVLVYNIFTVDLFDGMLISSFAIDLIMAGEYLMVIKKLSPRLLVMIGVFRLLGDLFAWIANLRFSKFVVIVGAIVLLMNLFYVCYAIEIQHRKRKNKSKKYLAEKGRSC